MRVILSVPYAGYFERTWCRLFWAYLMQVILSVPDAGNSRNASSTLNSISSFISYENRFQNYFPWSDCRLSENTKRLINLLGIFLQEYGTLNWNGQLRSWNGQLRSWNGQLRSWNACHPRWYLWWENKIPIDNLVQRGSNKNYTCSWFLKDLLFFTHLSHCVMYKHLRLLSYQTYTRTVVPVR